MEQKNIPKNEWRHVTFQRASWAKFSQPLMQASPMDPEFVEIPMGPMGPKRVWNGHGGGLARSSPETRGFFFLQKIRQDPQSVALNINHLKNGLQSCLLPSHTAFLTNSNCRKPLGFKKPESKPPQNTKVDLRKDICFFIPNHLALRGRTFKSYKGIHWLSGAMIVDDQDSNLRTLKKKKKNSRGMLT